MTIKEINALFQRIEELRDEIKKVEIPLNDDDKNRWGNRPLVTANSLLHQAEQTLLDANKWLGYYIMGVVTDKKGACSDERSA